MRRFAIAGFVVGTSVIGAACSSSSPSEFPESDAAAIDAAPSTCTAPIEIGNSNTNIYPGGSCTNAMKAAVCDYTTYGVCGDTGSTIWTCTCDGTSWSCEITGGSLGFGSCNGEDAGSDADASDAQDDADHDASDVIDD